MSVATWVTIIVITMPSGSRPKPSFTSSAPDFHIVQRWFSKKRSWGWAATIFQSATSATTQESTITPTPMTWFARLPAVRCSQAPRKALIAEPSSGKAGISQSQPTSMAFAMASLFSILRVGLLAQQVGFLDVDGAEGLVDGQHDGEADGRLGRRQHDDEDGEDLAGDLPRPFHEVVEGDEVHVGGVEDQLDAHEDSDCVAPRDHRHNAQREQGGAHDEEMRKGNARAHSSTESRCSLISLRAMITAPTSAASSTTDATSKGRRKSVRKAVPSAALTGW